MKRTQPPKARCKLGVLAALCGAALAAIPARAQTTYTWTNGGVANDIDDPDNWDQATAPASGVKLGTNVSTDIIRFDSDTATLPTTGMSIVRIANPSPRLPFFELRNGSLNISAAENWGWGGTAFTIGDGDMTTLAQANFSGTINLNRDGGAKTCVINADGTLKLNNNLIFGQNNSIIRLLGGKVDAIGQTVTANFTNNGSNHVSFEALGSTFTANFGGQLPDEATITGQFGGSFRLGGPLASDSDYELAFTDNGDGSFTVGVQAAAPKIASLSPADDAANVAVDANLVATFSENVKAGTGSIRLRKTSDGSTVPASVTFDASTVTIDPGDDLETDTGYHVTIDSDAVEDASGNPFAGIAGSDGWNFTTGSAIPPVLTDWRDLENGFQTPDENYADQPYFVVIEDGKWLLTLTTGPGSEGGDGQHVVSTTSTDNGQTWTPLVDIELTGASLPSPDTNILSSWVVPYQSGYRAPGASYNRVYAIYTWGDPYNTTPSVTRRDTHGFYAFRFTDDGGSTWSADRYIIPYTNTVKDDTNYFSGVYPAGWNVDKPLRLNGKMFLAFTKLSAPFGRSPQLGEGYIYRCDNIDTEGEPTALDWKMLPGTVNPDNTVDTASTGIREFGWGGEQEEFDLIDLTSGALRVTYRTTKGWIGEALSTDEGQTWTTPVQRRFQLDGRVVRHPRANCKVWKLNSGKYLMWHHHNGGTDFGRRNPVWVSIGTQAGNAISWGEPEVLLYNRDKTKRMSYPDMMEVGGTMYVSETEKGISRIHPVDAGFLAILDSQPSLSTKTTSNLQLEQTGSVTGSYTMPTLPDLSGYAPKGFTIETRFQTSNLNAGQTVFDTFSGGSSGVRMTVATNGAVDFTMSDGTRSVTLRSDTGTVVAGQPAHLSVHVDAPAKLVTMVANGRVGDGTNYNTGAGDRTFGWAHFDDAFADVNGGDIAVGSGLNGTVDILRVYDRALMHTESIANYRNASGISGPAVTAGIVPSDATGEPGQSVTFDASHSYTSELTTPVYTWDFGDGSPTVQGAVVNHAYASTGNYTVTLTISEAGTPDLQGHPVATLNFQVVGPTANAVITNSCVAGSPTVNFSAASSTLIEVPDPVYTWDFGDGNSGSGLTVEHTYPALQDYTVTLTISRSGGGPLGGSPVATKLISVGAPCVDVLVDINADGTDRTASTDDFEAAAGLVAGTFGGKTVKAFPNSDPGGGAFSQTVDDITIAVDNISNDADGWFGGGTDNNLLDDGLYLRNVSAAPSSTITLSGSGLGLAPHRSYELFLFAGRSQGHETTFTFDAGNPTDPSSGAAIHTSAPVVGGDETLGTAFFAFETGAAAPASLVIQWDGAQNGNGNQDAVFSGFALRDTGPATPPANTFDNWIANPAFGLAEENRDFTDDPDGDGLANGAEAFFGTNPSVFTPGLTEVNKSGDTVTFRHPNPDAGDVVSDIDGSYEWSLDLLGWHPDDATVGGTTVDISASVNDPEANTTTVTCAITGNVPERVFVRAVARMR